MYLPRDILIIDTNVVSDKFFSSADLMHKRQEIFSRHICNCFEC